MWARIILTATLIAGVFLWWVNRSVDTEPGILAPGLPVQVDDQSLQPFSVNGYSITPVAAFEVEARVLSKEHYFFGREADLSPYDLALGWGRMSDERILEDISISQSRRFYWWRTRQFPIPREEIIQSSSNMHIIPANNEVSRELRRIRKGHMVHFNGYLVRVQAPDGWHWSSSTTRTDTGNGSCELVWVEKLEIVEQMQF